MPETSIPDTVTVNILTDVAKFRLSRIDIKLSIEMEKKRVEKYARNIIKMMEVFVMILTGRDKVECVQHKAGVRREGQV